MKDITSLFIGGIGHSGTTMLSSIFNKNKQAFGSKGESRLIESLKLIEKEYDQISNSKKIKFTADKLYFGHQFKKAQFQYDKGNHNPLFFSEFCAIEPKSFVKDLNEIIYRISIKLERHLFVEKTPSNVFHINQIFNSINNSKVLIIQRDVRDVVSSLKTRYLTLKNNPKVFSHNYNTKKLDKDYNILIDSLMWNKAMNSWSAVNSKNLKVIKYEDFVRNPIKETKLICSWLEIEFHSEMLELNSRNSSDQQLVNEKGITSSSVKKYKASLTLAEIALIQIISGKKLKSMGYQLETLPFYEKIKVIYLFPKEILKIPVRVYKRFRLMKFSYFINFSLRVIKKLTIT